jgi:hypothetical protein
LKRLVSIILLLSLNLSVFQEYFEKVSELCCELVDIDNENSKEEIEDNDKFFDNIGYNLNLQIHLEIVIKNFIQKIFYINQSDISIQNPPPEFC